MCNVLIFGMLAMLDFHTEMENSVLFWIYWVAAIVFNMNWWRRIEDKMINKKLYENHKKLLTNKHGCGII